LSFGGQNRAVPKNSDIRIKRAYEQAERSDGYRVLVDRIWPRGVSRQRARVDEWAKELAPSNELRRWYGHNPERFEGFRRRYLEELQVHEGALAQLRERARRGAVTLVFAAKDAEHSNAAVLADLLAGR
jgi:uncharacterized protein YeaO (DUF488 family)